MTAGPTDRVPADDLAAAVIANIGANGTVLPGRHYPCDTAGAVLVAMTEINWPRDRVIWRADAALWIACRMFKGEPLPAVPVYRDSRSHWHLYDGFHRFLISRNFGYTYVPVVEVPHPDEIQRQLG